MLPSVLPPVPEVQAEALVAGLAGGDRQVEGARLAGRELSDAGETEPAGWNFSVA